LGKTRENHEKWAKRKNKKKKAGGANGRWIQLTGNGISENS